MRILIVVLATLSLLGLVLFAKLSKEYLTAGPAADTQATQQAAPAPAETTQPPAAEPTQTPATDAAPAAATPAATPAPEAPAASPAPAARPAPAHTPAHEKKNKGH